MGSMKIYGTETTAPNYSSNSIGTPKWSGLKHYEFTPELIEGLHSFITYEARLQGHNDSNQNRIGENAIFFHVDFLDGWPQKLWSNKYQDGVSEQQAKVLKYR